MIRGMKMKRMSQLEAENFYGVHRAPVFRKRLLSS